MARIYLGNQEPSDRGALEALRRLPDEFHVFVEFTVNYGGKQRQADFLVIREEVRPCSLFLLEVKNERRRLRGTVNGGWEVLDEETGTWRELPVSNSRDQNPLQQAQNTARLLRDWIISMQMLIQDEDDPWQNPAYNMTAFPRLVLPFAHPQNALQKDNFAWVFTSYDEMIASLLRFRGTRDFPLSRREIQRLAEHLGVQPTYVESPPAVASPTGVANELAVLRDEVAALRQEMAEALRLLRTVAASPPPAGGALFAYAGANGSPVPAPEKMDELCEAVVQAVRHLRDSSQKRFFPNVHGLLRQRFGGFQPQVFGFISFKSFMQEAERRGLIRLATINSADWALLPDEDVNEAIQVLAEPPAQFSALDGALQSAFVDFVSARGSLQPHMTANWLGLQLVQNGVLPMGTAQVRGVVMQAIKEGILTEGIHETVHRETGQPFFLRTVRLNTEHPTVSRLLQARAPEALPGDEPALEAREEDAALAQ
jgi:hypothetical protein